MERTETSKGFFIRDVRRLTFETPTLCHHEWEIVIHNTSEEKVGYVTLWIDHYFADLRVRDSQGRQLVVVPRSDLPEDVREEQQFRRLKRQPPVPLHILLARSLKTTESEIITLSFLTAYSERDGAFSVRHILGLIGYANYDIGLYHGLLSEPRRSRYVHITAPQDYSLRVIGVDGPIEEVHRDETSYEARGDPQTIHFRIEVPSRVTMWLLVGIVIASVNPLLAVLLFSANRSQFSVLASITAGIIALIVGMRALLFANVGLLNRLNKVYITVFALNLIVLLGLALEFVGSTPPMLNQIP